MYQTVHKSYVLFTVINIYKKLSGMKDNREKVLLFLQCPAVALDAETAFRLLFVKLNDQISKVHRQ